MVEQPVSAIKAIAANAEKELLQHFMLSSQKEQWMLSGVFDF